jgi:hypothetical protein
MGSLEVILTLFMGETSTLCLRLVLNSLLIR